MRFFAALLVVIWHSGSMAPTLYIPDWLPLGVLAQGNVGVSMFCVISGFILAVLYGKNSVAYSTFMKRRAARILPLFLLWVAISAYTEWPAADMLVTLLTTISRGGLPGPVAPGWGILIQIQFCIVFPALVFGLVQRGWRFIVGLVVLMLVLRVLIWSHYGTVQMISYYSLLGRLDQFLIGMGLAWLLLSKRARFAFSMPAGITAFVLWNALYYWYHLNGGQPKFDGVDFPSSKSPVFLVFYTIDALLFAIFLGWYLLRPKRISSLSLLQNLKEKAADFFAWGGRISYSIYLNHLIVLWMFGANVPFYFLNNYWDTRLFVTMITVMPVVLFVSWLTYEHIERPFIEYARRT